MFAKKSQKFLLTGDLSVARFLVLDVPDDLGNVGFAHTKRTESELPWEGPPCGHFSWTHFDELDLTNRRASDIGLVGGKVTSM
jgi:hypothetical protein